jgi:formylmethanofuran dehydrogenase subunit E-like metal-binding protein
MTEKYEVNKREVRMKVTSLVLLSVLLFSLCSFSGAASKANNDQNLMSEVFSTAEANIGKITPENTLIISDIGSPAESYILLDGFYSEFYKNNLLYTKNLLIVQNARNSPLWFAFFNKDSGKCTFIKVSYENEMGINYQVTEDINFDRLAKTAESRVAWDEKINAKIFDGREFAILTICNGWATGKMDYELLQALQIHNHFCPGISSGFVLADWIEKNYPLNEGVSYTVFACPNWCKEDVFIKRWDATPGKGGMWVSALDNESIQKIGNSPAGIYVVTDKNSGTMKAIALGFDFDIVRANCGAKENDPGWVSKYLMDLWLMNKENWNTQGLVKVISVTEINETTLNQMKQAGNNPYVVLGLLLPPGNLNPLQNVNTASAA